MLSIDDIQIFLATHNRANYIKDSIQSLLNQSIKPVKIIVLDNESTDNTQETVENFKSQGVKYIRTSGFLGNWKKFKELADKKYCMLFHDDDLLHPKYLEYALKLLNEHPDLSLITTRYTEFKDDKIPDMPEKISYNAFVFDTQKEFAEFLYYKEIVAYATAIYKTTDFKKCHIEYDKFSKFNDWPFMVKMASYGKSAIFENPKLFYIRRHNGQDTWTSTNTPTVEQIINWDLFFKNALNANKDIKEYIKFIKHYKHFLLGKYNAFLSLNDKEKYSAQDVINIARKMGIEDFDNNIIKAIYYPIFFFEKFRRNTCL